MRTLMNAETKATLLPVIVNTNASTRYATQKTNKHVCPRCEQTKPINSFCNVKELQEEPKVIKLYELCNTCSTTLIKRAELSAMTDFILETINTNVDAKGEVLKGK